METLSGWVQVYKHKRANWESLRSFRTHYPSAPITVVSDDGEDFSDICKSVNANYIHESVRTVVGDGQKRTLHEMTIDGVEIFLRRIYDHCLSTDTDWVVWLSPDVRTIRRVRSFPKADIGGSRQNPFSKALTEHLEESFGSARNYVYGAAGGGVFRRSSFITAYEGNRDLRPFVSLDPRVAKFDDMALGLLFLINGFDYEEWEDVSEIFHELSPVVRDSAFDHAYKYWYDKDFDSSLLSQTLD